MHKYVDDTTLSEILESKNQDSYMQAFVENLLDWADCNDMQVNTTINQGNDPWPFSSVRLALADILNTRRYC